MPGRRLDNMTASTIDNVAPATVFADPVAYLAAHGIEAILVAETTIPVAA